MTAAGYLRAAVALAGCLGLAAGVGLWLSARGAVSEFRAAIPPVCPSSVTPSADGAGGR